MRKEIPYGKRFEDYLKVIYRLQSKGKAVRVRDLAKMLGVKPSSIIEELRRLSRHGYVHYEKGEYIKLTEKGKRIAKEVLRKHEALRRFLREILMIPEEVAEKDACYMEHGLHEITLDRIEKFLEFIDKHLMLKGKMVFLERLKYYYEHGELPNECRQA